MPDATVSAAFTEEEAALATPFLKCLVRLIRAQEPCGSWKGKSAAELLDDFIVTRKQRRTIPGIGDPDPGVLWRLDIFYTAEGLVIEERFRPVTSPIVEAKPVRPLVRAFRCQALGRSVQTSIGSASRRFGNSRRPVPN